MSESRQGTGDLTAGIVQSKVLLTNKAQKSMTIKRQVW